MAQPPASPSLLESSLSRLSLSGSGGGSENIMHFPRLDPVIIVLSFLEPQDLCTLACVNREWNAVINSEYVWRQAAANLGIGTEDDDCELEDSSVSWKERTMIGYQWPRVGEPLSVLDTCGIYAPMLPCDHCWSHLTWLASLVCELALQTTGRLLV